MLQMAMLKVKPTGKLHNQIINSHRCSDVVLIHFAIMSRLRPLLASVENGKSKLPKPWHHYDCQYFLNVIEKQLLGSLRLQPVQ